jgi:hypothetical protein
LFLIAECGLLLVQDLHVHVDVICDSRLRFGFLNKNPKSSFEPHMRIIHIHIHMHHAPCAMRHSHALNMPMPLKHKHLRFAPCARTLAGIMLPKLHIRMSFLRFASEQKQNAKCDIVITDQDQNKKKSRRLAAGGVWR